MKKINEWLTKFTSSWKAHDINAVLSLFTDDVEYWETPFTKLATLDEVRAEWMNILNQQNIDIHCIVYYPWAKTPAF